VKNYFRDWRVEVITSWDRIELLKDEWDALVLLVKLGSPFLSYDGFSFWYSLFKTKENIRILVLRQLDGQLRAVFPGYLHIRRVAGLSIRCFSSVPDGDTPGGGIIARSGDHEAIKAVIQAAVDHLRPIPQLIYLSEVPDNSDSSTVIYTQLSKNFGRRIEHSKVVPIISLSSDWGQYYASRSVKTRSKIRRIQSLANKTGRLGFAEIRAVDRSVEVIARLKRLDAYTWQGQHGTGLFSTPDRNRFFSGVLSPKYPGFDARVYLATINDQDIAYSIVVVMGKVCVGLKTGYDLNYSYCSPGSLIMCHVLKQIIEEGVQYIDLGSGINDEKRRWETDRVTYNNWWLFNHSTVNGRALEIMTLVYDFVKKGKHQCPRN
jgi:CelD/BcsL family acetyltransferase involved in cellulose biosynthesis